MCRATNYIPSPLAAVPKKPSELVSLTIASHLFNSTEKRGRSRPEQTHTYPSAAAARSGQTYCSVDWGAYVCVYVYVYWDRIH